MTSRLRDLLSLCFAAGLGFAISTGHPAGIVTASAMPVACLMPRSRKCAFANALAYYSAGLWPMIPGVGRFTGQSALMAILIWATASVLLSLPWMLAWMPESHLHYLWRVPVADIAGIVPPFGLVG